MGGEKVNDKPFGTPVWSNLRPIGLNISALCAIVFPDMSIIVIFNIPLIKKQENHKQVTLYICNGK